MAFDMKPCNWLHSQCKLFHSGLLVHAAHSKKKDSLVSLMIRNVMKEIY